jgi:BirA family biotin operon repressor/biotin-[acetyl-CoA-carboxylase] ligase
MATSELLQMTGRLSAEFPWLTVAKYFEKVDSTQSRVVQFLPKEDTAAFVIAESQTKGVGRNGRAWVSAVGGTWFTLALPMKTLTLQQVAPFSMVAALSLVNALREVHNLDCDLKWPNDIQYEGKKLAGILLNTTVKSKKPWLLIGVGINVNNDLPSELSREATTRACRRGRRAS